MKVDGFTHNDLREAFEDGYLEGRQAPEATGETVFGHIAVEFEDWYHNHVDWR